MSEILSPGLIIVLLAAVVAGLLAVCLASRRGGKTHSKCQDWSMDASKWMPEEWQVLRDRIAKEKDTHAELKKLQDLLACEAKFVDQAAKEEIWQTIAQASFRQHDNKKSRASRRKVIFRTYTRVNLSGLFSSLLPKSTRENVWEPSFEDLRMDHLLALRLSQSPIERRRLERRFKLNLAITWASCYLALAKDRATFAIRRLVR